jgi:Ca-activated chloride channel homolog
VLVRFVVGFRRFVSLAGVLIGSAGVVAAQQQWSHPTPPASSETTPGPTFRAGVDVVALTVAVTDRDNRFIGDLEADDFLVFEDGVSQPLSFFGVADVPLDLALLVDSSASMQGQTEMVTAAASGLLQTLRPDDRASLIEFRDVVRIREAMTSDVGQVTAALAGLRPAGGTALYNALYVSLRDFARLAQENTEVRRQAIVVLSDGDDTTSLLGFDEVLEMARRSGVTVYTVGLRSEIDRLRSAGNRRSFSKSDHALRTLARETGGQAFFADEPAELRPVYAAIGEEFAHQYAIGYTPVNPKRDGAYRRVVVRVASRGDARTRTRSGYFAASAPVRAFWQDADVEAPDDNYPSTRLR